MKIEWNKVTWYSKLAAVVVFLATFLIAFNLGILWEQAHIETAISDTSASSLSNANTSTQTPASAPASASTTKVTTPTGGGVGARCGGLIRNAPTCASGLHCKLGAIADKGGVCVAN